MEAMIPAVGERLRQFEIVSKAGEGGMGVVFRAHDTRLGRDVALKFLTRLGAVNAQAAERLRIEARSLAALAHANIVTIYDIDEIDGAPFLVLEWVSGTSLDRSDKSGPWGEEEFLGLALPIAEALAAAHTRNIVHRDLKPANVLLADDGTVKLVDFGIAKMRDQQTMLTQPATLIGTVSYMSPEQATGKDVGTSSDVFSFGVLAYELLTGRRPFEGANLPAVLHAIAHDKPEPLAVRRPDLSPELVAVIDRCLRKDPKERVPTGGELARELHDVIRAKKGSATPVPRTSRMPSAPEIRYCRTADGVSIAYSTVGTGPPLVRVLGWFTHVEMEWEWPALRLIWEQLARSFTVVRYDGRGVGLSAPWSEEFSEETRQNDLDAVVRAVGDAPVTLYGISEGGWTAAQYAASHPERVGHLVVYGSYTRGLRLRSNYDPEELDAMVTLIRKGWGRDTPEIRQFFTTRYFGENADPGLVAHFNRLQRAATDGDTAARYQKSLFERGDARPVFASIRTPTLVIHCRDDQISSFEEGRIIAETVPGAQFLPLPTQAHYFPIDDEVTLRIADAIERFAKEGT